MLNPEGLISRSDADSAASKADMQAHPQNSALDPQNSVIDQFKLARDYAETAIISGLQDQCNNSGADNLEQGQT